MTQGDLEKRLAAQMPDVAIPPALEPAALSSSLEQLARRARRKRARSLSALAAALVVVAGASVVLARSLLFKAAEAQYDMAAESAAQQTQLNDALPASGDEAPAGSAKLSDARQDLPENGADGADDEDDPDDEDEDKEEKEAEAGA